MAKILVDANVLIGIARSTDSLHTKAISLLETLGDSHEFYALNLVIQESATVISMRDGMSQAKTFLNSYKELIDFELPLSSSIEKLSWEIFMQQTKKGSSFVDCANMATLKIHSLSGIISFDSFYPKSLLISPKTL